MIAIRLHRMTGVQSCVCLLLLVGCHATRPAATPNVETILGARAAVRGHQAEATQHFRKALKADPYSVEKQYQLAVSLKDERKFAEALPLFKKVAVSGDKNFVHPARVWIQFIDKRLSHQ